MHEAQPWRGNSKRFRATVARQALRQLCSCLLRSPGWLADCIADWPGWLAANLPAGSSRWRQPQLCVEYLGQLERAAQVEGLPRNLCRLGQGRGGQQKWPG